MRPTQTFIDLIRTANRDNALDVVARLRALTAEDHEPARRGAMCRHLEALAFRLEGDERLCAAAETYDLIAALVPGDQALWTSAAATARLRDLCQRFRFDEAEAYIARLRAADAPPALSQDGLITLLRLGWTYECRSQPEPCLHCYRLAYDLNGGDAGVTTEDGDRLSTKVKNLRRLLLDSLLEDGRFDAAIALHETTRHVTGSGPLEAYDIVSVQALAAGGGAHFVTVIPERRIAPPALRFWEPPPSLRSEAGSLDMPAQYLAFLDGARAFPRSNVVIAGDKLVYDLAAHPRRPDILLQDGLNPDQIMTAAFGATRALVEVPEAARSLEAGLMMFGLQSRNYGHWFCEFVPRMLCYNDPRCPDGIPLCIDDHMPASHGEILRLLDTRGRPVITLAPEPVTFGRLGIAPVPAFFPFDMKPGRPFYDTIWPADVFGAVRQQILDRARERGMLSGRTDRRLFISRKAFTQRALVNEAEIAERLRPLGFEVIYPETMSFLEQVEAFHSAALVVGSSSSALSNALFCRPGCRIVGLIHEELAFNFRGYASFIEAGGARILFLRGRTLPRPGVHAFHVSYIVDPETVVAAVAALEAEIATDVPAGFPVPLADDRPIRVPERGAARPLDEGTVDSARVTPFTAGLQEGSARGVCALEADAYSAGDAHSDRQAYTSPSLAAFVRTWGDGLPQVERDAMVLPLMPRLQGTRGSQALERRRVALFTDWLVRTHVPAWFRLAKLNVEGDALADLPEIEDVTGLAALCDHLSRARKRAAIANLTLRQTGPLVRAAAWDATHRAAWTAIQDDLKAAGPRILAAGWDAAYAAAYAAARACQKAPLEPTRIQLQDSALALVERAIALRAAEPAGMTREADLAPRPGASVQHSAETRA
ncbi:glycosyltransferase family 61 protein [Methylobacterium radiotolerans]|uniref:glycosyltransferase family 61 protein n=1 Tax=Methylobacterium radiotolerans TaxID=31998 RepID=UPI00097688B8|nr:MULTISPECIES: glycosyltransferase family 61 protein [Methylobacterium]MDE3749485.1 glycosyltransferase family 61 protein [Methylobacterium radiotolerans]PVY94275.1 capsular polysaccharide biosynthesis protein [Methylobacterium organophilum]